MRLLCLGTYYRRGAGSAGDEELRVPCGAPDLAVGLAGGADGVQPVGLGRDPGKPPDSAQAIRNPKS